MKIEENANESTIEGKSSKSNRRPRDLKKSLFATLEEIEDDTVLPSKLMDHLAKKTKLV